MTREKDRRTLAQRNRDKRNTALWRDYKELAANPANAKTVIRDELMRKYRINNTRSYYKIIKAQREKEAKDANT